MPFVQSDDFSLCSRFYADLGFAKSFDNGDLAVFRCGSAAFFLQNFRWPSASQHYELLLDVDDVEDWWRKVQAEDLVGRYGVRVRPPRDEPWGARELHLTDPTGVLWRISQRLG
jgi:uncharacterized glyoxalase superfamily protein PhnB